MSIVKDTLLGHLPAQRKTTPSGWVSFNAPCCVHNGHSADTRNRGGVIDNGDSGVSYHCFNCGFKASWQSGRTVSHKLKKLLSWIGVSDTEINKLCLDVMRENEGVDALSHRIKFPEFTEKPLPIDSIPIAQIQDFDKHSIAILEYMAKRNLEISDTDYHWCPSPAYRDRLIIPFYYQKKIVGWTARTVNPDKKPKYLSDIQPGFVYGMDLQTYSRRFTIVCEGQIDAIHIQGCSLGGSEISEQQALLLNSLNKPVIVVPDRDKAGEKLVTKALENEWHVSMPDWSSDINDISDCVDKHGRLFALYTIVKNAESSPVKVKLAAKKWFN